MARVRSWSGEWGERLRWGWAGAFSATRLVFDLHQPNSTLFGAGVLPQTPPIEGITARGGIAIVIAHRPSALVAVDLVAIVQNGRMVSFGKKHDIMTPGLQPAARNASPGWILIA